ncbi:MAG: guanylate kinase [Verrucomicrobiales bacterium]
MEIERTGILFVVSGPSGSGKTTVCRRASDKLAGLHYAVSCTTRDPRIGEVDGQDYHFLAEGDFVERIGRGEFLEHAHVHAKNTRYGTLRSEVEDRLRAGTDVIIDIDVQGAAQVRGAKDDFLRASAIDVFILSPAIDELRRRLAGRGTETPEQVEMRMRTALEEVRHWREYDYAFVSGAFDEDLDRMIAIIRAERCRASRLTIPDSNYSLEQP